MELGKFKEFELKNDIMGGIKLNSPSKQKKNGKRFLKGPIDWAWLSQVAKLPGKTLHVCLALHHISELTKSNKIKMQGGILKDLGINRKAYSRAIEKLEEAGLISVDRKPGQTPVVTILDQ